MFDFERIVEKWRRRMIRLDDPADALQISDLLSVVERVGSRPSVHFFRDDKEVLEALYA